MQPTPYEAERFVAHFLCKNNFQILALNFRRPGTEIDIIARRGDLILFVEVKYRLWRPKEIIELIPWRKRQAIQRGIREFMLNYDCSNKTIRVDLAIVTGSSWKALKLEYQKHAFQVEE